MISPFTESIVEFILYLRLYCTFCNFTTIFILKAILKKPSRNLFITFPISSSLKHLLCKYRFYWINNNPFFNFSEVEGLFFAPKGTLKGIPPFFMSVSVPANDLSAISIDS